MKQEEKETTFCENVARKCWPNYSISVHQEREGEKYLLKWDSKLCFQWLVTNVIPFFRQQVAYWESWANWRVWQFSDKLHSTVGQLSLPCSAIDRMTGAFIGEWARVGEGGVQKRRKKLVCSFWAEDHLKNNTPRELVLVTAWTLGSVTCFADYSEEEHLFWILNFNVDFVFWRMRLEVYFSVFMYLVPWRIHNKSMQSSQSFRFCSLKIAVFFTTLLGCTEHLGNPKEIPFALLIRAA